MSGGIFEGVGMEGEDIFEEIAIKFKDSMKKAEAKQVAHIYCQTKDGTVYEVNFNKDSYYHKIKAEIDLARGGMPFGAREDREEYHLPQGTVIPPELGGGLSNTDVTILPFDSVKALEEIVVSNPDDFLEKIIDKSTFMFTELGTKIIRNIRPNEEHINRLYKSLRAIEKRAEWFDPSKLLGYSDVDGDPATIVASVLKESIKGSKKVPKDLKTLMEKIFKGYTLDYPGGNEKIKERILTIISFFVEFADVLSNQQ